MAKKYHPDLRPEGEDATAQFKLATEAHEILSDAGKRREYDRAQRPKRRVPVWEGPLPARRVKPKPVRTPRRRTLDIEAELRLVPEEVDRGGSVELRVSVGEPCRSCEGQVGAACSVCEGEGTVVESRLMRLATPPGLRDGMVLCVPGCGRAAVPDGPRGDLYLTVRVRPCW